MTWLRFPLLPLGITALGLLPLAFRTHAFEPMPVVGGRVDAEQDGEGVQPDLAPATSLETDLARAAYELLERECFECHGGKKQKGRLSLRSRSRALKGGARGALADPDDSGVPLLLAMTSYRDEDHQMPPQGKLGEADRALLVRWIEAGLPYPEGTEAAAGAGAEDDVEPSGPSVAPRGDGWEGWAYRPVSRPAVPALEDPRRGSNAVDAFVLQKLEQQGLEPVGAASANDFVRRATYDLTGLPPTPDEVAHFEQAWAADQEAAVAALIERLLASPHYGEKWARHWLDLVRFAETNGFERDTDKPHVWRYRDWVVDALNRDLPYDRFARAQLAGDEIAARMFDENGARRADFTGEEEGDVDQLRNLVATGFYRIVQWDDEPGQGRLQARYDTLADVLATTSGAFLGTTMGCARCHDHPADPFSQEEYYSLMSFLHGVTDMSVKDYVAQVRTPETEALRAEAKLVRDEEIELKRREVQALSQRGRALPRGKGRKLVRAPSDLFGIHWRLYRDTFTALPEFDQLRHEEEGVLVGDLFSLEPRSRDEAIGFVQEALLAVPAGETRSFRMSGGDAARLLVDGQVVLEYAEAAAEAVEADFSLSPGSHDLRIEWVHRVGAPSLRLNWRPHSTPVWRVTEDDPGEGWHAPSFDDGAWAAAPGGFGQLDASGARVTTAWESPDLWLRRSFAWTGEDPNDLVLVMQHDEDVEVWLNGVLALERSGYRSDYGVFTLSLEARDALLEGQNQLAVHVHNTTGGQFIDVVPAERGALIGRTLQEFLRGWRPLSEDALGDDEKTAALQREAETDAQVIALRKQLRVLQQELDRLRGRPLPGAGVAAVQERGTTPEPLHVHQRGNAAVPGQPVEPAVPAVLGGIGALEIPALGVEYPSSGRRLALARWLASTDNPLFARVMVNRLWQHHFGRGLVSSPSDFGELGERPTHLELLDWLAVEFSERGWSLKEMHRLLMSSQTYRMSSVADARALELDPSNRWFWRFPLRRLTAEEIRDSMLATSGELNPKLGGESFYEPVSRDVLATSSRPDAVWGTSAPEDTRRRSLYIKVKRSLRPPLLTAFDAADTDAPCAARFETVQPAQALTLLNSSFARARATALARRTLEQAGDDDRARAALARRLALGREALPAELEQDLDYLRELREEELLEEEAAWEDLCLLIYNLAEFVYLD